MNVGKIHLYTFAKCERHIYAHAHRKKEESNRNTDGLTNFSKQMCSSRMAQRTWTCVEGREKTHRADTGVHMRTHRHT